jgi:hypothetical protein
MPACGMSRSHSVRGNLGSIAESKTRAEVILPRLDGSFGSVAAVTVWGNSLEVKVVLLDGLLELVGAFIVKDVEVWGVVVALEAGMQGLPGLS